MQQDPEPGYYMPEPDWCQPELRRWHQGIRNYDHSDRVAVYKDFRPFWEHWPKPPPAVERRLL